MDLTVPYRIGHNMKKVKIPKAERQNPLLQGLARGDRRYMFSLINLYNPVPARKQLYYKHRMLCEMAFSN